MVITLYSSTEEVLIELGNRIKKARIAHNITQKDMANRTGLSLHTISNLENGKDVSLSTMIEILRVLGQLQNLEIAVLNESIRPSQLIELGKPRERVRKKKQDIPKQQWKWGDEE